MQLKQLSRIVVQFAPTSGNCRSAREFLKRATGPTAKKSNPDCQVEVKLRKGGDPEVHVVYTNAQKNSINISAMSASQIEEEISQVASEMELNDMLKKGGAKADFGPDEVMTQEDMGQSFKVPRAA